MCLNTNDKYKYSYSKTQSLRKRQLCTCFLCVCWWSFYVFWRSKIAISAHRSVCL